MNLSSVVLWFAEAPWGFALVGRWTALLGVAWVAHLVLAKRDPRWRVLVWRSAAVGLATIIILTAAPPFVTWRLTRAESIVVPMASFEIVVPVADPPPVPQEGPVQVVDLQTSAAGPPRRLESAKRSSGVPAVSPRITAMTAPSLGSCLLAIWLLGVAVMALRLGLCLWRVSRIVGRSTEVPARVIDECRAVAAALGCRQAVRVVQTTEVAAPCLTGLFRPWLLLPAANCEEADRADLRAILAHELARARRHDLKRDDPGLPVEARRGISGVVLLPDGRPAAGAQVVLGTRENRAFVRGGLIQQNLNAETTTTGPDGRLTVPRRAEPFLLAVAINARFADATSDEFAKTGKLVLQHWGRIEGEVRIGRKPAA